MSRRPGSRHPRDHEDLRLFVAVYPPGNAARDLSALLGSIRHRLPAYRALRAEQIHLTLQFVGDTRANDLDRVVESVERSAAGLRAFDLTPLRLLTLPRPLVTDQPAPDEPLQPNPTQPNLLQPNPRLVAVETDSPSTLLELVRRLATRLARRPKRPGVGGAARHAAEGFTPHLTLCRFTGTHAVDGFNRPAQPAAQPRHDLPPTPDINLHVDLPPFRVERVALMRSELRREGAEHFPLASVNLLDAHHGP